VFDHVRWAGWEHEECRTHCSGQHPGCSCSHTLAAEGKVGCSRWTKGFSEAALEMLAVRATAVAHVLLLGSAASPWKHAASASSVVHSEALRRSPESAAPPAVCCRSRRRTSHRVRAPAWGSALERGGALEIEIALGLAGSLTCGMPAWRSRPVARHSRASRAPPQCQKQDG